MEWLKLIWTFIVTWWPAFMAAGLPFIVNLIANRKWSTGAKQLIAGIGSVFIGIVGAMAAGIALTPDTAALFVLAAYGGCQASYAIFKKLNITCKWLEALLDFGTAVSQS